MQFSKNRKIVQLSMMAVALVLAMAVLAYLTQSKREAFSNDDEIKHNIAGDWVAIDMVKMDGNVLYKNTVEGVKITRVDGGKWKVKLPLGTRTLKRNEKGQYIAIFTNEMGDKFNLEFQVAERGSDGRPSILRYTVVKNGKRGTIALKRK